MRNCATEHQDAEASAALSIGSTYNGLNGMNTYEHIEYMKRLGRELADAKLEGEKLRQDLTRNMNSLTLKVDIFASELKEGQQQLREGQRQIREGQEKLHGSQHRLTASHQKLIADQRELTANVNQLAGTLSKLADFIREVAALLIGQDGRAHRREALPS